MLYAGLIVLFAALLFFWLSARQRKNAGLPGGRIIYTDTRAWKEAEKPFYDQQLGLTGKPDYLVEHGGQVIPVEVKSGRTPAAPYDSHIFQLAAYCRLVHHSLGKRPPYGIIHYQERDFAVDYTPELESALLELLADMRRDERRGEAFRSHESPARCLHCGFRQVCDQKAPQAATQSPL
jgi:CRISPR-associated exonuclease Cas4